MSSQKCKVALASSLMLLLVPTWKLSVLRRQSLLNRALIDAVTNRDKHRVHQLLEKGADANFSYVPVWTLTSSIAAQFTLWRKHSSIDYHLTPLMIVLLPREHNGVIHDTSVDNYTEIVQDLLDYGANPNVTDARGHSALRVAIEDNSPHVVRMLLEEHADPNQADTVGDTPIFACDVWASELLLKNGAHLNVRDKWGMTPLMNAAGLLNKEKVKWLIAQHVNVDSRDASGHTALYWVRSNRQPTAAADKSIISYILKRAGTPE